MNCITTNASVMIAQGLLRMNLIEKSDFCIMVLHISKAFICSSIESVIQMGWELQGQVAEEAILSFITLYNENIGLWMISDFCKSYNNY